MNNFVSFFGNDAEVSDVIYMARMRNWRNTELAATDWTQVADTQVDKAAWAIYRQALRDLPTSNADARQIELPVQPGGNE